MVRERKSRNGKMNTIQPTNEQIGSTFVRRKGEHLKEKQKGAKKGVACSAELRSLASSKLQSGPKAVLLLRPESPGEGRRKQEKAL